MKKKAVTLIAAVAAFSIKLWQGFIPPVQNPGDMASGAMNDPIAVVASGIMAAVVVWGILESLFWIISKIVEVLEANSRQKDK